MPTTTRTQKAHPTNRGSQRPRPFYPVDEAPEQDREQPQKHEPERERTTGMAVDRVPYAVAEDSHQGVLKHHEAKRNVDDADANDPPTDPAFHLFNHFSAV